MMLHILLFEEVKYQLMHSDRDVDNNSFLSEPVDGEAANPRREDFNLMLRYVAQCCQDAYRNQEGQRARDRQAEANATAHVMFHVAFERACAVM